ncbi:competence/damage-inducible protein A [Rhodococcus sp. BP-149]|uniref:competence/damage-inducible protein A n=1 Tax=unclassified Rhodococcus (in: high G+C Gram-positive bacteria) TaxID=192944 RepID=UPI001C9A3001|nr:MULTISPECIES: competence/damage-inducible protein A [unclassified Rhodococcus (in: high G+C Gram-positive bacteria)]MBY6687243.1 competence/damage-inducible protein A [Rhodococcus sp. BP-288]MBY6694334.1 competence/damage-inducible protein A [Rhodococcus sp. BP-188]MBY6698043.1 competence/damage-inducible protein A [Rhodococcus sp. BP-285]MBY6704263.1 competence/damage-inducible protein A [Rhodococcus sp. BP-283]MBY6712912.1 competence/damage-inducible protein A [Rhodococcus sp. BP-160]
MAVRAGVVVTGSEVLAGRVSDRNGPWVARQLLQMGVDVAHLTVCGDRPADLTAQVQFLADQHVDLIITTGGLGPTADDLTVETVAALYGREMHLDVELEGRITSIVERWRSRLGSVADSEPLRAGVRKQAMVPAGAQSISPTGTAPGVAMADDSGTLPTVLILPGPPSELQSMWPEAIESAPVAAVLAQRTSVTEDTIRAYGLSEADLAATLRTAESSIAGFGDLAITTCLSRGELEMVTRYEESAAAAYSDVLALIEEHHGAQVFSTDGSTIDDIVATRSGGRRIATAESCTGGMIAARLTDRAGSSAYVVGGVVSYANEVKIGSLDVPAAMIEEHGAVSEPVAARMAEGAMHRVGADVAVSTSGVAGPGGGTESKPVGTVCFGIAATGRPTVTRTLRLPGDRASVRALSVTVAMHMLADALGDA